MLKIRTNIVKSRYVYLAGLTLLYLLVRLLVLFSAIDKVHLDEELYRGNIAKELISGPILPFFDYQRSEYEGGSLANGVLAVPFFLLFGETLVSLKLVGLAIGTGIFILWYLFLDRFFNRRVAIWTSLLFILPPPLLIKPSISSYGVQYQVNLFTMLAILIFYQIFFVRGRRRTLFGFLGAVCGFGLFFHYSFLPTLLTIILFWVIFDKKFFLRREFFIFSIAFLAGFSPWIYYNLTHNFQGLIVCDRPLSYWLGRVNPSHFFLRTKNFLMEDVGNTFTFEDNILNFKPHALLGNPALSHIYYFVFALSFCGLSWLNRRSMVKVIRGIIPLRRFTVSPEDISKETFLLMFFVIFVFTFSLSGIQSNLNFYESNVFRYRTVGPVCLLIPAIVAIFLHENRIRFRRFFNLSIMAGLLGLGFVSNLNFISDEGLHKASLSGIYRGYNYYDLGRVIAWRFDGSPKWLDSIKGIKDAEARRYCYSGMGWGFAEDRFRADYQSYLNRDIYKIERDYRPYAYEWMGEALEREIKYNKAIGGQLRDLMDSGLAPYFYRGVGREAAHEISPHTEYALRDFRERIDEEYKPYFFEGLGISAFDVLVNRPRMFCQFMESLDKRFKADVYRGLAHGNEYYRFIYGDFGSGIGRVGYDIGKWEWIMKRIEEEYRPACYERLGIEAGWRFIHDIKKYVTFLEMADRQYWPYLYRGLGTGIGWRFAYDIEGCIELIKHTDRMFWPYIYEGLGIGVARRYAYQKEVWAGEDMNIPEDYRPYFNAGTEDDFERRHGGRN